MHPSYGEERVNMRAFGGEPDAVIFGFSGQIA
jgi:hypothetical protein